MSREKKRESNNGEAQEADRPAGRRETWKKGGRETMSTMQERWVLFCAGQHPQRNLSGIVEEFVASEVRLAMAPKESSAQLAACERWALGVVDEPDLLRHTTLSESTTALRIIADELTRLRYENARLQSEVHAKAEPAPSEDRAIEILKDGLNRHREPNGTKCECGGCLAMYSAIRVLKG